MPTVGDSRIWSSGVFRSLRIARAIRREKMVRGLFRITQGTLGLGIDVGCYRNRPIEGQDAPPPKVNGWNWKFGGLRVHVAPFFYRGHSYRLHVFGRVVGWFSSFSFGNHNSWMSPNHVRFDGFSLRIWRARVKWRRHWELASDDCWRSRICLKESQ